MTPQERKNKTIAALTTTGVNLLLLLLMIFAGGWGFSGEGLGQGGENYGIEVNLGYDEQGSGDVEPGTEVGRPEAQDDEEAPAEPQPEPETEERASPPPREQVTDTKTPETETFTDPNSDVEINETKKEQKPVEKTIEKKPIEKVEKPAESKPVEKPIEKPKAVYKGKTTSGTSTDGNGQGKKGTPGNQGDDVGAEGNKGVEGGREGAAIYKGTPGGGGDGGTGLVLYGWEWDNIPKPNIPDNETGRVVFEIEVDDNGELIGYRKESGTVSAAAERACIASIQKLTFSKKPGAKVPPVSKGKITFVIRAQ